MHQVPAGGTAAGIRSMFNYGRYEKLPLFYRSSTARVVEQAIIYDSFQSCELILDELQSRETNLSFLSLGYLDL